ncbi:MAG: PGF-pre-PGF domain-containing protein [Nanoarchaeota archaeon]
MVSVLSVKKTSGCGAYITFYLIFLAVIALFAPVTLVYGAPEITYNNITPDDNATVANNWINISINSSEELNQSILEWGWANGSAPTNFSMINDSLDNKTWSYNVTGLSTGRHNYTIWAQNTTNDNWTQTEMRFVFIGAISACQDIIIGNVVYTLIQNVNSSETCFNILANNVTIDGAGYTINYSQNETGYAINNSLGYNITTIKNLTIVQENSTVQNAYAIFLNGTTDVVITNNTITTSGNFGHGIVLNASNLATLLDNNVTVLNATADGILLISSFSNTISEGSIYSVNISYELNNSGASNNFKNTNFTDIRNISFLDTTSSFNYNNETSGNIWLKTNVSVPSVITRTLLNWSNITMQWNDTNSTAGILANYTLTGLLPDTIYYIYNTSGGAQNKSYILTTNSAGVLPSFNISLNGTTEMIVDSVPSITVNSPANNSYYNLSSLAALVLNITTNEPAEWCGFSLNGTSNITMNNSASNLSWNYSGISVPFEGLNNITFFCNDSRGNIGASATKYFTKDTQIPDINVEPTCDTKTSSSMRIVWNVSSITNNYVDYKISGSLDALITSSQSSTATPAITLSGLSSSTTYAYTLRSCDLALNCDVDSGYTCATASSTTTTTDDSSSSGGIAGGDTPSGFSKSWQLISAGSTAVMTLASTSVDVTDIIFKATQALSKAKITVSKLSAKPSATSSTPPGAVFQYIGITPENITDGAITSTTISFRVNSTWISSNAINSSTITLYRYANSQWNALVTHHTGTSGSYTTYLAETPGFSYFAIAGNTKSLTVPAAPVTNTTTTNVTLESSNNTSITLSTLSSNSTSQNNETISTGDASSSTRSYVTAFIVIIIAVVVMLIFREKLKIKFPEKLKVSVPKFYAGQKAQTPGHKYTFNASEVKKAELVYKPQPKEEKVKYAYKPKK